MKKVFTFLLSLLITAVATAQSTQTYVVYEDFESGSLDSVLAHGWQVEQVSGTLSWQLEASSDAKYPTGSYAGNWQLSMRNTTGQTQGAVTRLISPVMDLTEVYHPMVVFAHAQAQRTGDVDELRVYYRTSADTRWIELATYDKKITAWKNDTIFLTGANATYQVMFEATDHFGRGVVLDEIIVRPEPQCEAPQNIRVSSTVNSAEITWGGALDALTFDVVVLSKAVNSIDEITPADIVYQTNTTDYSVSVTGLSRFSTYYVYVRSNCPAGETQIAGTSFDTKNLQSVPYTMGFNQNYVTGTIYHVSYWTHGTSIRNADGNMEFMPFINANTAVTSRQNFSFDTTSVLVFTGARNTSDPIPAGEYVYGATPEFNVESLSNLQVSFWGTGGQNRKTATSRLIVGAMTDPGDFNTFVPVDTAVISQDREFNEFYVNFASYKGQGKYVAFASDFKDADNIFYLDNLVVELREGLSKPAVRNVNKVTSKSLTLVADLKGAGQMNVIVADTFVLDASKLAPAHILVKKTGLTGSTQTIDLPDGLSAQYVQVYVQAASGSQISPWSLPYKARILMKLNDSDLPVTYGFEERPTAVPNLTWALAEKYNFVKRSMSTTAVGYTYPDYMYTDIVSPACNTTYHAVTRSENSTSSTIKAYKGSIRISLQNLMANTSYCLRLTM